MKLIHDPIARTDLLLVGFGAVVAAVIFVLIGTRFQHWLERWALPRHLSAASKAAATLCSSRRSIGYVIACFERNCISPAISRSASALP
jgi:hypothetical protein